MQTAVSVAGPVKKLDPRTMLAATFCVAALFTDYLGWLLAIAGIVLLRGAAVRSRTKWLLATTALAPKILFFAIRWSSAPPGVSFTFEPWTLASSSSLWAWSVVMAAAGVLVMMARQGPVEPASSPGPPPQRSLLPAAVGLALIAGAAVMLLGLIDGFHRIDDAGGGRWALKHAARGTRATFTRDELASIEGIENHSSKGGSSRTVRVALTDGRTFSVTTRSLGTFEALQAFAATANLAPGKARITRYKRGTWTNGAGGFALKDVVGTYEHDDKDAREHSRLEFWLEGDRLAGKETVQDATSTYVRALQNITLLSETGEVEFTVATRAESQKVGENTTAYHLQWSGGGERGRFTKDGFVTGLKTYKKTDFR